MNTVTKTALYELAVKKSKNNIKEPLLIVSKKEKRPASTVLEKRVLAYLSEIFDFPINNLLDNFLELGGGSLKAAQLITHLKQVGYNVSMEDVFNSENLSTFTTKIEEVSKN